MSLLDLETIIDENKIFSSKRLNAADILEYSTVSSNSAIGLIISPVESHLSSTFYFIQNWISIILLGSREDIHVAELFGQL